jgi:hypothetical protein
MRFFFLGKLPRILPIQLTRATYLQIVLEGTREESQRRQILPTQWGSSNALLGYFRVSYKGMGF